MSSTAVFEHAYYIGNYMSGILYGFELIMYFLTMHTLFHRRRGAPHKHRLFLGAYSTALFVLVSIDLTCNAVWGEQMWITFRGIPGGPSAFIAEDLNVWYQILGSTSVVALIFLSDAFLIYRCYILWQSNFLVILFPLLVYVTAFVLAILNLVVAFVPGGNFFGGKSLIFGTAYYAMTIGLNALVTALIIKRLFSMFATVRAALGEEDARLYTSVAAIVAESAAPYSLVGIMFLVPYARASQTSISFGQVWAKLALIILRVVTGRAWTGHTIESTQSSVSFSMAARRTASGGIFTAPGAVSVRLPRRYRDEGDSSVGTQIPVGAPLGLGGDENKESEEGKIKEVEVGQNSEWGESTVRVLNTEDV